MLMPSLHTGVHDDPTRHSRARRLPCALLVVIAASLSSCGPGSSGGGGSTGTVQGPAQITRGPQVAVLTDTSVDIAWLSSKAAIGAVEYGLDPELGRRIDEPTPTVEHLVRLVALLPGLQYFYRVTLDGIPAGELHTFVTEPADASTPFRFDVFGDLGSGQTQAG